MGPDDVTLFSEVDHTADPGFFARFLDEGNRLPAIVAGKAVILDGLRLKPGDAVLDAGCGTGEDVVEIAAHVGPDGRVVGVDLSEVMVAEARKRAASLGLPVSFEPADVSGLPFPDGVFDACRSERMLMHVADPAGALAEMARVTRAGGRVCVFDFDWDTLVVDSPYREVTRDILRFFADRIRQGWVGRQLPRLFKEQGLVDVEAVGHVVFIHHSFFELLIGAHLVAAQAAGLVTPDQVRAWWDELCRAQAEGNFHVSITALIVSGTKP